MGSGTVFPEMVMGFAETVTHTVEAMEETTSSAEEIREIATACRQTRDTFSSFYEWLKKVLTRGVDVATFVREWQPRVARLDKILMRHAASLAEAHGGGAVPSEVQELLTEFALLGQVMSGCRDLLKEGLLKMQSPRPPVDWQRIQDAQAAHRKEETRPFAWTPKPN